VGRDAADALLFTFNTMLLSTGCDVEGLDTEVGAKTVVWGLSPLAPPHFNHWGQGWGECHKEEMFSARQKQTNFNLNIGSTHTKTLVSTAAKYCSNAPSFSRSPATLCARHVP